MTALSRAHFETWSTVVYWINLPPLPSPPLPLPHVSFPLTDIHWLPVDMRHRQPAIDRCLSPLSISFLFTAFYSSGALQNVTFSMSICHRKKNTTLQGVCTDFCRGGAKIWSHATLYALRLFRIFSAH